MKKQLNQLGLLTTFMFLYVLISCSHQSVNSDVIQHENESDLSALACVDEDPKARITNNNTIPVDIEIFDDEGNLLNAAYNVAPGTDSGWLSFQVNVVTIDITTTESIKPVIIDMQKCMAYDAIIDSSNHLNTDQPTHL